MFDCNVAKKKIVIIKWRGTRIIFLQKQVKEKNNVKNSLQQNRYNKANQTSCQYA